MVRSPSGLRTEAFAETVQRKKDTGVAYTDRLANQIGKWQKDELAAIGDFECGYCDFRDTCYPQLTLTEIVEAGGMTEDQALERLYDARLLRRPVENQEEIDEFFAMPDY